MILGNAYSAVKIKNETGRTKCEALWLSFCRTMLIPVEKHPPQPSKKSWGAV
jgi:hypothetical protein